MGQLKAGGLFQQRGWASLLFPTAQGSPRHPRHQGQHQPTAAAAAAAKRQMQRTVAVIVGILACSLYFIAGCWHSPTGCGFAFFEMKDRVEQPQRRSQPEDFLIGEGNKNYTNPFKRTLPEVLQRVLKEPWRASVQQIPVVQFYQRPGALPCNPKHYIARGLKQARKLNSVVYLIGPEECQNLANELDILLDPYTEYRDVVEWFRDHIGYPVGYQVRWFVLRAFMERHAFPRVFYMDSDVLLFANVSDVASMLFKRVPLLLSVRWPSLRQLGPSQYATTAVSGHVSMWTYDALCDFLSFFELFIKEAVLGYGYRGNKTLVTLRAYNDMVPLGWYTYKLCWMRRPEDLHPQCIADQMSGVTPERSIKLRGKFAPKFRVESFAAPRWCNKTDYVDEGWCVFDNNFSVQSPKQFFKYRPDKGMKTPTSMHYTHFEDWSKDQQPQTTPVQFLAVHFQAHKKGYLERWDNPAKTWGSNKD